MAIEQGIWKIGDKPERLKIISLDSEQQLEEQERIVAKVDELLNLRDSLKTKLNQTHTTQIYLTDALVEQAL